MARGRVEIRGAALYCKRQNNNIISYYCVVGATRKSHSTRGAKKRVTLSYRRRPKSADRASYNRRRAAAVYDIIVVRQRRSTMTIFVCAEDRLAPGQ